MRITGRKLLYSFVIVQSNTVGDIRPGSNTDDIVYRIVNTKNDDFLSTFFQITTIFRIFVAQFWLDKNVLVSMIFRLLDMHSLYCYTPIYWLTVPFRCLRKIKKSENMIKLTKLYV